MGRNDRNILVLGGLILVLLAVGYYFLLLNPLRQQYLTAYGERTQKEAQERQLEQTASDLENVRRDAPNIERQILEYSKRIPTQDEIPSLVVQIQQIADEAKVTQLSIQPSSPEAPPGGGDFSRIPITMSFEGTYEELQDFLLRLRNLARLVTVNEVNYEPVEKEGENTVGGRADTLLTVEISAETYVQPAAGEATTSAGVTTTPTERTTPAGKAGGGKAKSKAKSEAGKS